MGDLDALRTRCGITVTQYMVSNLVSSEYLSIACYTDVSIQIDVQSPVQV